MTLKSLSKTILLLLLFKASAFSQDSQSINISLKDSAANTTIYIQSLDGKLDSCKSGTDYQFEATRLPYIIFADRYESYSLTSLDSSQKQLTLQFNSILLPQVWITASNQPMTMSERLRALKDFNIAHLPAANSKKYYRFSYNISKNDQLIEASKGVILHEQEPFNSFDMANNFIIDFKWEIYDSVIYLSKPYKRFDPIGLGNFFANDLLSNGYSMVTWINLLSDADAGRISYSEKDSNQNFYVRLDPNGFFDKKLVFNDNNYLMQIQYNSSQLPRRLGFQKTYDRGEEEDDDKDVYVTKINYDASNPNLLKSADHTSIVMVGKEKLKITMHLELIDYDNLYTYKIPISIKQDNKKTAKRVSEQYNADNDAVLQKMKNRMHKGKIF